MLQLDHVVHVVPDLDQAVARFRELGFHVAPGGQHPNWGTHNALIFFDLNYIELVAVRDPQTAAAADFGQIVRGRLARGEGPETACLRTDRIAEVAEAMRSRDVPVSGPSPGSRRRPDGSVVRWQGAFPPQPWPFLIQWGEAEEARRQDLRARGAIAEHPVGQGLRLRQVGWAVRDLDGAAGYLKQVYGLDPVGSPFIDEQLAARCLPLGASLLLCAPMGAGPVQESLERFGERPFLYEIAGRDVRPALLLPDEALGAWIRLRPVTP